MIAAPPEKWVTRSPNCSIRRQRITAIIVHTTGGHTAQSALSWFERTESQVSAHVVIDRDGTIYRVVADDLVAWHAGKSVLEGVTNVNRFSLGVELVGMGGDYPLGQIEAAAQWVANRCALYAVPVRRIVGHADVAVPRGRKSDPQRFPWDMFRARVASLVKEGA